MIRVNSCNSFFISGFLHIMIAGIVLLMLKTDYKIAKEIDISFLFNSNEKETQKQEIKSQKQETRDIPLSKKTPTKPLTTPITTPVTTPTTRTFPSNADSVFTETKEHGNVTSITSSLPKETTSYLVTSSVLSSSRKNLSDSKEESLQFSSAVKTLSVEVASQGSLKQQPKSDDSSDISILIGQMLARIESFKRYPYIARRKGIEGVVLLKIILSNKGELVQVSVKGSSGHEILDRDAVSLAHKACSNFKFNINRSLEVELPIKYSLVKR